MTTELLDIGLPENMTLQHDGYQIEISRTWFNSSYIPMLIFAIVWNGFLFFWYTTAFLSGSWLMILFPIGHVCVGVGLAYRVIAGFLNKTYITADSSSVTVAHKPVPYFGNKTVASSNIKQLFVKDKAKRSKNSTSTTFEVHILTHDRKNIVLLKDLPESEQAYFIEQEIEKYLNITDIPVRGQLQQ